MHHSKKYKVFNGGNVQSRFEFDADGSKSSAVPGVKPESLCFCVEGPLESCYGNC